MENKCTRKMYNGAKCKRCNRCKECNCNCVNSFNYIKKMKDVSAYHNRYYEWLYEDYQGRKDQLCFDFD